MQNSSGFDFSKILDQTLYTYMPEKIKKLDETSENLNSGVVENGINMKLGLVGRLRPMVELIAISEIIVGSITLIFLVMMAYEYDKIYATEDTGLISLMCFVGLLFLIVNGMMLLTSLKMEKKKILGFYLLLSTLLWIYIFGLSVMKIHYALVAIENNANKAVLPEARHFLLSNACIMGVVTMLGSVIHFIGNVCVFTYYNLKYVQPIMLNCGP